MDDIKVEASFHSKTLSLHSNSSSPNEPPCKKLKTDNDVQEEKDSIPYKSAEDAETGVDEVEDIKEVEVEAAKREYENTPCFESLSPILLLSESEEPKEILKVTSVFEGNDCYTKGCKWSPDGTCLLTNSNDNMLRLWDLPSSLYNKQSLSLKSDLAIDFKPAVNVKEGGLVYDYCWYPLMSSWDPPTCCFATASRGNPGHLWDAFTGSLRATYRAYNHVDEVEPARCVAIDPTGERLYFGFNNNFRVFRTSLPGRECLVRNLKIASRDCQCGIVSCISVSPSEPNLYAVGTYLKTIGLYSELEENVLCVLRGHEGGLTHLRFSPDGLRLYSGARKDSEILCWDLREPGKVLFSAPRKVTTHQRIYFDLTPNGRFLISGTMDGDISVWDTDSVINDDGFLDPVKTFKAHDDCTNGASAHPFYTILASCSGQRHFEDTHYSSSESEDQDNGIQRSDHPDSVRTKRIKRKSKPKGDYSLKLWWSGPVDQDSTICEGRNSENISEP